MLKQRIPQVFTLIHFISQRLFINTKKSGLTYKVNPLKYLLVKLLLYFCTPSGIRTLDPLIKSQLLYQLS